MTTRPNHALDTSTDKNYSLRGRQYGWETTASGWPRTRPRAPVAIVASRGPGRAEQQERFIALRSAELGALSHIAQLYPL